MKVPIRLGSESKCSWSGTTMSTHTKPAGGTRSSGSSGLVRDHSGTILCPTALHSRDKIWRSGEMSDDAPILRRCGFLDTINGGAKLRPIADAHTGTRNVQPPDGLLL